ncbi:hypothetical protein HPB49_008700 [Dermacentor silvarum]|uniref:Uncharacterized protein n=1 Tax=Dermacentor silvarum TaxID=543639 RepID=A0ACB8DC15_DERSI|nr:oxytocin receptor [Dermacentor silvarum]KAH7965548.1 hypothetical protein HPB49_008700 [Dermacentor silvarum]
MFHCLGSQPQRRLERGKRWLSDSAGSIGLLDLTSSSLDVDNDTTPENATIEDAVFGPQYAKTLRIACIGVMLVLSLVGNSFVCYRLLTSRRQRLLKTQVLFLNLALADLLVTVVTMNSQLLWEIMGRVWVAGDVPCRVFKLLQTYALVSSNYMLVGIAVDRHFAICNPLKPAPKPRTVAATCWLLSLVPSVPNLFAFRVVVVRDERYCASVFYVYRDYTAVRQVYMAFVFALVFVVPLVALVALYANVLFRLWRVSATAAPESLRAARRVVNSPGRDTDRSTLPKVRVRTLKMAAVISLAFLVTNLPYMVQEIVLAFAPGVSLGPHAVAVFGVISASNSAVNPYIYLAFNGGAGAAVCGARVRGMWRRMTRSSTSKRTTLSFRTQCSTLKTPNTKRMPAPAGLPLTHDLENCEMQEKASEKL